MQAHGRGARPRVRRGERQRTSIAHITSPSGKTTDVPMEWTVEQDGEYRRSFVPDESGLYDDPRHRRRAIRRSSAAASMHVRVSAGDAEYFDAAMRAPLLKRIAEETGGRFFTPANAASLPEAISYSGRGVTVVEERELWDMPALLLAAARPGRAPSGATGARGGWHDDRRLNAEHAETRREECLLCGCSACLCVLIVGVVLAAACCARRPPSAQRPHLLVDHRRRRATRSTRSSSRSGRRAFIDAAKTKDGVARRQHHLSRREARRDRRAFAAARRARRREGVRRYRGARAAGRRGRRPADRPRQLRRQRRPPSTCPGPDLTVADWATLLGKLVRAAGRVRQHGELERRVPADRGRARAASSSPRRRPAASATRRSSPSSSSRRSATTPPTRDRNGHVSMQRSVRVREGQGRRRRTSRRGCCSPSTRRSTTAAAAALAATHVPRPRGRARRRRSNVDTSDPAMRALVEERDAIEKQIAALKLKKTVDGRARSTTRRWKGC